MPNGIVRKVDRLGRIVVPAEIRRALRLLEDELVDIYLDGDRVCIEALKLQCVHCGSKKEKELLLHREVHICRNCLSEIKTL